MNYTSERPYMTAFVSGLIGIVFGAFAVSDSTAQQPVTPVPPIALSICNYCIEMKRLVIPLRDGSVREVSAASFGPPNKLKNQGRIPAGDYFHRNGTITSAGAGIFSIALPPSDFVLEVDDKVAPVWTHMVSAVARGGMPYLKTRDDARYKSWVRTDSGDKEHEGEPELLGSTSSCLAKGHLFADEG